MTTTYVLTPELSKKLKEPFGNLIEGTPEETAVQKMVYVDNPQGTITQESIFAIKEALESNQHTHIVVKGEEDLLTLIAVLYAPEKAFVVYGQPYLGIVIVKVSSERKARVLEFLNSMKASKS